MTDKNQVPLLHRLPLTRIRLRAARIIYRTLKLVLRDDHRRIRRGGINYEIDLSEGIDLSLFMFGSFQDHVTKMKYYSLPLDAVVFDVGANIGGMALGFAQRTPQGHVYAFEPTAYAYQKLLRNLSLNPELAARTTPVQAFLSDHIEGRRSVQAYSSWKVDGSATDAHPVHGGVIHDAESVEVLTIDEFCRTKGIERVDLIKIDTDGHELSVLQGARETLAKHLPCIIFEAGLYLIEENGGSFDQYIDYLTPFGYKLINSSNLHQVSRETYRAEIPLRATTDIVALPPERSGT
jgi:FkbM family methyltransferase